MNDLLNNEIELGKFSSENMRNSLNNFILRSQNEKEILVEEPIEEISADIQLNRKESEYVNVSLLYEYKNLLTFVKYFSASEILLQAYHTLEEMTNVVAFIVNSSSVLLKECEWNYKTLSNNKLLDNLSEGSEYKLVISHVTQFFKKFVNSALHSANSQMPIHIYKFNSGAGTKIFQDFEPSLLVDSIENKKYTNSKDCFIKIKKFLLPVTNRTSFSDKCEINEALSKAYNSENDQLNSHSSVFPGVKAANFIRLIIFTGSPTTQIDTAMYNSIMSTFNRSKNKIRGAVVNFMCMENDFYFSNAHPDDEILKFSDVNYTNVILNESTEKMKALCEIYEGIECEIKELSDRILQFGMSYFDPEKINEENEGNVGIIVKFVKKIDSDFKLFSDLVDAVKKYQSDSNKKDARKDIVINSRKNLEELADGNLISQILNSFQKTLEEFYLNKSMKEKVFKELKSEVKTFYEKISRIEKKIRREGKQYQF